MPGGAKGLAFGLFDDSFMCKKHDIVNGKGGWNEREFLNHEGLYGTTWAQAAARYHMTFVIANDSPRGPCATAGAVRPTLSLCDLHPQGKGLSG